MYVARPTRVAADDDDDEEEEERERRRGRARLRAALRGMSDDCNVSRGPRSDIYVVVIVVVVVGIAKTRRIVPRLARRTTGRIDKWRTLAGSRGWRVCSVYAAVSSRAEILSLFSVRLSCELT